MDRNVDVCSGLAIAWVALHRSAWIEIHNNLQPYIAVYSRTPQECVDRNCFNYIPRSVIVVALHRSAWIEICAAPYARNAAVVALHRSAWIEIDEPIVLYRIF